VREYAGPFPLAFAPPFAIAVDFLSALKTHLRA
jgi:hypothetical protein